jgi:2,5-diamino-6-(ribosylamino)-4(3H)-pyrimidinone 5'-phosphate reductase
MSADGKIALPNKRQLRISSEEDIKRVHRLRNSVDAILVGIRTVLSDDPKLTVKEEYVKKPKAPVRIVLDTKCRTPIDSSIVKGKNQTLILTTIDSKKFRNKENVEIIKCRATKDDLVDLDDALNKLHQRGIKKLLVEGGGTVIWNFLKSGNVDEMYIYVEPVIIGGKKTPTVADGDGVSSNKEIIKLELLKFKKIGTGILFHYKMKHD